MLALLPLNPHLGLLANLHAQDSLLVLEVLPNNLGLRRCVTPYNVATGFRLKIPWSNDHCVTIPDPDSTFHLAPDPAETVVTIGALDQDSVVAKKLGHGTEDLARARSDLLLNLLLGDYLLLSRLVQPSPDYTLRN